jgi:hypothetical protein
MLLCADIPCEPVTIKADPRRPGRDSHTYAQAITIEGIIPTDTSQAAQHGYPVGWEPEAGVTERTPWGIMQPPQLGSGLHGYVGLGQTDAGVDADTLDAMNPAPVPTSDNSVADLAALQSQGGVTAANCAGGDCVTSTPSSSASSINWTNLGTALGADAARIAQLATLPAGYTLNAAGQPVLAGTAAIGTGLASLFSSPLVWLLIGAAILIPAMESGKR